MGEGVRAGTLKVGSQHTHTHRNRIQKYHAGNSILIFNQLQVFFFVKTSNAQISFFCKSEVPFRGAAITVIHNSHYYIQ